MTTQKMENDTECGVFCWRPRWLQRFATSKTFIAIFGLLGTIQAMSFVYFIATLTTLEKRFQMPSQTMGILMSGNEISQIMLVVLLSYLGGKGNRPLWISCGVAISAISCFILALPHFIYGPGEAALALTAEHQERLANASFQEGSHQTTNPFTCDSNREAKNCSSTDLNRSNLIPMILIFLSQFVLGIGTSLYFSLGPTYMDDNTKKSKTPMFLGIMMALRTLGPAGGFVLGSLCLRLYIQPNLTPIIERRDPRWLGAWWLGWVLLGSIMLLFSFLMRMFPQNMPKREQAREMELMRKNPVYRETCQPMEPSEENSLFDQYRTGESLVETKPFIGKDVATVPSRDTFWSSLKRIMSNPLLMVNNLVAVFYILGASGYINFFNKYTETQYNSSASTANFVAAVTTVLSLVLGFLGSGYAISRWRPKTSFLLLWNIGIGCMFVAGEIFLMFLACPDENFHFKDAFSGNLNIATGCNSNCGCDSVRYSPVCDLTKNLTFFSACHAGCTDMQLYDNGKRLFSNCTCIGDTSALLTQGPCPVNCGSSFILFMATVCLMQMIGSTGRITNVLINYRSVLPQDKAIAQGLALMLISLFAFIPGPIIFGKIVDNACLVWDNSCGEKGNCWLYDKSSFRIYFNATAAGLSGGAVLLDIILWRLGRKVALYDE